MSSERLPDLLIGTAASLREALEAIDRGGIGLAVVVSESGEVVGVVSDGDIRRRLIAAGDLYETVESVVQRSFVSVDERSSRSEVLDLLHALRVKAIPVLSGGRLVGMHVHDALLGPKRRPNRAVLLAGGRGSRMGELTSTTPKPMLRVAGRPVIERLLLQIVASGIEDVALSIAYLGNQIEDHFGDGSRFGCSISYLRETAERPLGTAGPLGLLVDPSSTATLVVNGDVVTNCDLGRFLDFHETCANDATVGLYSYRHRVPFGVVHVENDRLVGIEEKPELSFNVSAGIYVLDPSVVGLVQRGTPVMMTDLLSTAVAQGLQVGATDLEADWIDVGSPADLERARGLL